ncbi:protein SMG9 [Episyrphus balteatus]|uniref:protein SMG9 n=1 Tax=Episyrphus balteatus TaxID=286459 RepID=UPI0024851553|nr:protein SMG9 [Episyrphus balteatus]
MSENRKKRYRKPKPEEKRTVILAKRDPDRTTAKTFEEQQPIQPKILLKAKDRNDSGGSPTTVASISNLVPQKTIIVTKDSISVEGAIAGVSNLTVQPSSQSPSSSSTQPQKEVTSDVPITEPTPIMTRPATVISSTSQINFNASKFLIKNNKDFLVVGIVGRQGVGKSTIMNMLAAEEINNEVYKSIFKDQESIFPIKIKPNKGAAWPRTESIHMYITKDRMILLDSPPVLCNSYKKDELTNEMDDMHNIIIFLSVCHLVIFVQNDHFDMSLVRLFTMSEMTKPNQDTKPFVEDYYPNVLFVKNRAKRLDFSEEEKEMQDKMLRFCFEETKFKIFLGETDELKKGHCIPDADKIVNSFRIPEFKDDAATSFHSDFQSIAEELRQRVFMTPRNQIYSAPGELTEAIWFELLTRTANEWNHFFFRTYKEARINHYQNGSNSVDAEKFQQ